MTKSQKRVGFLVRKWREILGISPQWEFHVRVYEREEDCPKKERKCAGWIRNEGAYLRSVVSFNLWHQECRDDLESVVTHELLHCVFHQLDAVLEDAIDEKYPSLFRDLTESITTTLELAFAKVRKSKK